MEKSQSWMKLEHKNLVVGVGRQERKIHPVSFRDEERKELGLLGAGNIQADDTRLLNVPPYTRVATDGAQVSVH